MAAFLTVGYCRDSTSRKKQRTSLCARVRACVRLCMEASVVSGHSCLLTLFLFFKPGLCCASTSVGQHVLCRMSQDKSSQAEWHQPQKHAKLYCRWKDLLKYTEHPLKQTGVSASRVHSNALYTGIRSVRPTPTAYVQIKKA